MKKEQNPLTEDQNRFIPFYIKHKGVVSHACLDAGIGEATFYRWRKDPVFLDELNAATAQAAQLIKDTVLHSFIKVFLKADEMLMQSAEPPKEPTGKGKDKEKAPKPIKPILRGNEYVALGKELMLIAEKLTPAEKTENPDADNFLKAVEAIRDKKTTPIQESVGYENPNLEEDFEDLEEDDLDDDLEEDTD
jgi:hypothetical protein